jgi:hypothetical protein
MEGRFKICNCYEYKKNAQAFSMMWKTGIIKWTMSLFKYCPYCGKELKQVNVNGNR